MSSGMNLRAAICLAFMGLSLAGGFARAEGGIDGNATQGLGTAESTKAFESMNEEEKTSHAASKVARLLKLLSTAGKNPTALYKPKRVGTTTGYDLTIPGSALGASTFYTRPSGTEVWHVALSYQAADLAKPSPLTQAYESISTFLGTPHHETLSFIISEGDATLPAKQMPPKLQAEMELFADAKGLIYLTKGINLFTRIKMPDNVAFKTIQSALLMGGTIEAGTVDISGSVGSDILTTLLGKSETAPDPKALSDDDKAKKAAGLPPVSFYISLPGAVPAPFNQMDEIQARKSFYMKTTYTGIGFEYDQATRQVSLSSAQDVSLWIAGRELATRRYISFSQDKSTPNTSLYELRATGAVETNIPLGADFSLKKLSLDGTMKVDIAKSTWVAGEADTEAVRNSGIQISSHRGGTTPPAPADAQKAGKTDPNQKTSALSLSFGVTVGTSAVGDLGGAIGLSTETLPNGKSRIKEVFFQFNGDPRTQGMRLASIPALAQVPGVNEFSIRSLGIGIAPAQQGSATDFYLYGDVEWIKPEVRGRMGLIVNGRDVTFLSRVTDFNLRT